MILSEKSATFRDHAPIGSHLGMRAIGDAIHKSAHQPRMQETHLWQPCRPPLLLPFSGVPSVDFAHESGARL
jgi:hypothetical protein